MAIVENFWLKNQRKKLAGAVIYQAMGQTRSRELATSIANPRTQAQMNQRVKWANLVNLYRANRSWMKFAFETKTQNQTDYNKFMSLNVTNSRIYLPKNLAQAGAAVAAPYIFTQGSLPAIQFLSQGNAYPTSLLLSGLDTNFDSMTVAQLTENLLANNPYLQEGDQISLILNFQQFNNDTGIPYVITREYELILSKSNQKNWNLYLPDDYISAGNFGNSQCLSVYLQAFSGTFLMCISRTIGGRTLVSSQTSIAVNNDSLINLYSSERALQESIASYGESEEPFLTSTTANVASISAPATQIIAIEFEKDGRKQRYLPGENVPLADWNGIATIWVIFDGVISSTDSELTLTPSLGNPVVYDGQGPGSNQWEFMNDESPAAYPSNAAVEKITVELNGRFFEAAFLVKNENTVNGIE